LNKLQSLNLYENELSGSIPESLGNLSNLLQLGLSTNKLSGRIPNSLGNLKSLQKLYLNTNKLSGTIPESLGNLSNLYYFYLYNNQLSGTLPESLGNLSNLQVLHLRNNQLCGEIPLSLMKLSYQVMDNRNPEKPVLRERFSLNLQSNHLTASDPELIEWLNARNSAWARTQTPCPCFVYGLHDGGLNNSQLFTIEPYQDFEIKALGPAHLGYDLEGLDMQPKTLTLYASSGDDPAKGLEHGYLYQVNKSDGTLTPTCRTGLGEVSAMAFHPQDGSLWVWADGEGLFTIDLNQIDNGVCDKTEILLSDKKVEGLTWDNQGKILYAAFGKTLSEFVYETGTVGQTCDNFPAQVEALSSLKTGELLFALHQANDTGIHSFDIESCSVTNSVLVDTPYTDIEGIAWRCPE